MTFASECWPRLSGVLVATACFTLLLGLFSQSFASDTKIVGSFVRIADNLRPYLLLICLLSALVLFFKGARIVGSILAVAAFLGIAWIATEYLQHVAPRGTKTDLTVIWFNVRASNELAPKILEKAIYESGADLVVFAEALRLAPLAERLGEVYPYSLQRERHGSLLVLSSFPVHLQEPIGALPSGPGRTIRLIMEHDMQDVEVVALHLGKPWDLETSDEERNEVRRLIGPFSEMASIVVGDFNAAPWSRRMLDVAETLELHHPYMPVATWPVVAGSFGIPIDHVLLRGPTALVSVSPWGLDFGSNHRGLIARLELTGKRLDPTSEPVESVLDFGSD